MGQNSQCWKRKRRIHVNTPLQNEWVEQSVSGMTQDGFVKVIWQTETGSEINLLCWCHSDSECLDDVSSSSHDFFWRCLSTLDCFPNSKQRHDLRSHALTNRSAHQLEIFQISYASSHLYDRSFWYSGGPCYIRGTVHEGKIYYIEIKKIQHLQMICSLKFSFFFKTPNNMFISFLLYVSYCPQYVWMLFLKIRFCSNLSDLIIVLWIKDGSFNVDIKKLVNNPVFWWKFTW